MEGSDVYLFHHTWKVNDLWLEKTLFEKTLIASQGLRIPPVPELEWKILLVPHNAYVGVFLSVEGERTVDGLFDVKFVNTKNGDRFGLNPIHFSTACLENDIGHKEFMLKHDLIEDYLADKELIVLCQIIVANIEVIPRIYEYQLEKEAVFHQSILLENFKSLYGNIRFADVDVLVGKETYRVHKLVLAARSPVLAEQIRNAEKSCCHRCTLVIEEGVDCDAVKQLLCYTYTGKVDIPSAESAMALYAAAGKYGMQSLGMYCFKYIFANLTPKNALDVYLFARRQRQPALQQYCEDFIAINREWIKEMDVFKDFKLHHPVFYYELSNQNKKFYERRQEDHTYASNS